MSATIFGDFIAPPVHDRRLSPDRLSALCGLAWGLLGLLLMGVHGGPGAFGGLLAGPLIGLLIGRLSRRLADGPRSTQIAMSLVDLYLSAALFGASTGLLASVFGPAHQSFDAVVVQYVIVVLWGLTFAGYWIVLWPLSYFTHRLVWRAGSTTDAGSGGLPPPEVDISADAVRHVAVKIMLVAVLAQVLWSVMAALDVWHIRSRSVPPQPWWMVTGLMRWGAWFVFGWLTWMAAPLLSAGAVRAAGSEGPRTASYGELAGVAGFVLIAYPLVSFASTWIVMITKVTLVQSWPTEGRVLLDAGYYLRVLSSMVLSFALGAGVFAARLVVRGR